MTRKFMLRSKSLLLLFFLLFSGFSSNAQTSDVAKPSVVTGEVVSIEGGKMVVSTQNGQLEAIFSDKTEYKRVPPENLTLKAAVPAAHSDIGVGDRVMVTGVFGANKSVLPARAVYILTKSDLSQKQAKDTERWRTRGIAGRVVSVDPVAKNLSVEIRGLTGATTVVLTPKADAKFLRYAQDSVKYSEAKSSSIAEIAPGDLIRAVGDRTPDGASMTAEEIITGAFQTRAGAVKSINAESGEVVISDLQTKKDLTIIVSPSSVLKRFPPEMAQRMAQSQMGGGARPVGQPAGSQATATPPGAAPPSSGPGQMRMGGGPRGGIDEMLERFPNITIADLKVGDMIAVSSSRNPNAERVTAIKLLAGVEPFIQMAQATAGPQRPGGRSPDFNIPGLDSVGLP